MAYPQRSNWGSFNNLDFNLVQSQIEQETLALLRERDQLSNELFGQKINIQEPYLKPVESQKYIKLNSDRNLNNPSNHRNILSDKVRQLLDLCKKQNSAFSNQLMKVLREEKNIYSDLANSKGQSQKKTQYFGVANPIIEAQKQSSVVHGSQQQQFSNPSSGDQSPTKINLLAKPTLREAVQKIQAKLTADQLLQMIEEIERKALREIEKLREEKIDLMKQLKQEIQSNNELQKQLNNYSQQSRIHNQKQNINSTPYKQFQFEDQIQPQNISFQEEILRQIRLEMEKLRQQNESLRLMNANQHNQNFNGFNLSNLEGLNPLRQRITLLEEELRNRDEMIKELSLEINRVSQQGGSPSSYQLSSLLEQGETIRQNTMHLIRMKQGEPGPQTHERNSFHESERIRELEELLERQEEEKQNFLNDLLIFKQKYQQLEEQNRALKRQSKFGSSDLAKFSPIYDKSVGQGIGASIDDYEKLLSQMKSFNKF